MRDPRAALRFRSAADGIFDRIEESPEQFGEHGLLAVPNGRALFYLVRRAVLPVHTRRVHRASSAVRPEERATAKSECI